MQRVGASTKKGERQATISKTMKCQNKSRSTFLLMASESKWFVTPSQAFITSLPLGGAVGWHMDDVWRCRFGGWQYIKCHWMVPGEVGRACCPSAAARKPSSYLAPLFRYLSYSPLFWQLWGSRDLVLHGQLTGRWKLPLFAKTHPPSPVFAPKDSVTTVFHQSWWCDSSLWD